MKHVTLTCGSSCFGSLFTVDLSSSVPAAISEVSSDLRKKQQTQSKCITLLVAIDGDLRFLVLLHLVHRRRHLCAPCLCCRRGRGGRRRTRTLRQRHRGRRRRRDRPERRKVRKFGSHRTNIPVTEIHSYIDLILSQSFSDFTTSSAPPELSPPFFACDVPSYWAAAAAKWINRQHHEIRFQITTRLFQEGRGARRE